MSKRRRTRQAARKAGYRSKFEQNVAEQARADGIEFEYEPGEWVIEWQPKPKKYTPDFVLPNGIIVETKGRFTVHDRQKHLAIKAQHPDLDIRFVFQYDNRLDRRSATTYTEWCDKHEFEWAMHFIPEEWMHE